MTSLNLPGIGVERGAEISRCGLYRYRLWRVWDAKLPRLLWIMINPSTADADRDDPTIRRCVAFAKAWGFGGIEVINLFAFRTPKPSELYDFDGDRFGPGFMAGVHRAVRNCAEAVAAWGVCKYVLSKAIPEVIHRRGIPIWCLGTTKDGHPRHPLYVRGDQPRIRFEV